MNKHSVRFFILLASFLFFFSTGSAQSCKNFHLRCKIDTVELWHVNEHASSFFAAPGETLSIQMEIMKAKDYSISLCGDDFVGNVFHFQIIDGEKNVLYDNANDDMASSFSFSALETKKITLMVDIPDSGSRKKGCVGVLIEDKLSVNTGF